MNKPYEGLKVIELEGTTSSMFCGKALAGLGAEVIKIERPGGDPRRKDGPYASNAPEKEKSLSFAYFNTGKKSVSLDLTQKVGRDILLELLADADVLIESFEPGKMKDWNIDYHSLRKKIPSIIMLSITPFGQNGPHSHWHASSDLITDAMGGTMADVGIIGRPPLHLGGDVYASMVGMYGMVAVQAAYHDRKTTGMGAYIDLCEQECLMFWKNQAYGIAQITGNAVPRRKPDYIKEGLVTCKDGFGYVMIGGKWLEMLQWMKDEGLDTTLFESDPLYDSYRTEVLTPWNEEVCAAMNELATHYKKTDFMLEGQRRRIPIGMVESVNSLLENEHFKARGCFTEIYHPALGKLTYAGAPVKMTKSPIVTNKRAPLYAEHNQEIFKKLGYMDDELRELACQGVI